MRAWRCPPFSQSWAVAVALVCQLATGQARGQAPAEQAPAPYEEEDPDEDEGTRRIRAWIDATERALERAHQPHIDLRKGPLNVPRTRTTTGTSWLPSNSPSYSLMFPVRRWGFMVRGNIFLGYGGSSGERGTHGVASVSTLLLAAIGAIGPGELVLRSVLSLEGATGAKGTPAPLWRRYGSRHDRQYSHSAFHELAATVTWPLGKRSAIEAYAAWPGSAALGPPDYAFRPSAFFDPVAPLTRNLLESTRSCPGVLTLGFMGPEAKLEGSWFSAPDRDVPDLGLRVAPLDSGSVRASFSPLPSWMFSLSYGHVKRPLTRRVQHRAIASSIWQVHSEVSDLSITVVAGAGLSTHTPTDLAAVVETAWRFQHDHTVFWRMQALQEARAPVSRTYPGQYMERSLGSLALGYVYSFHALEGLAPGLGVRAEWSAYTTSSPRPGEGPWAGGGVAFVQLRQASLPGRVAP